MTIQLPSSNYEIDDTVHMNENVMEELEPTKSDSPSNGDVNILTYLAAQRLNKSICHGFQGTNQKILIKSYVWCSWNCEILHVF